MTMDEQAKLDKLKMPDIGDLVDGRYRVQSVLATGGMGVILRAEQLPMGRPVALKLLHPHVATANPKVVGRFKQEVQLAKLLNHPNAIRLYDFGESNEGLVYVAMEYLEGCDLKELIAQQGALPMGRAVEITRQMLDGLAEAHSHDFIHRDLKPSNVFITANRRGEDFVKLLDFGIAKSLAGSDVDLTAEGSICGTPGYVSPEHLRSEPLEKASDVYAVGLMLLEMLIGQRVFQGESPVQTMMMHLQIEPDIPLKIARTPLCEVIHRATVKDPAQRYGDADQMMKALEAIAEDLPIDLRVEPADLAEMTPLDDEQLAALKAAASELGEADDDDSADALPQGELTPVSVDSHTGSRERPRFQVDASSSVSLAAVKSEAADHKSLWMIGGALIAVVSLALVALVLINPGDSLDADEAGQSSSGSAGVNMMAKEASASDGLAAVPDEAEQGEADASERSRGLRFDLDSDPSGALVRHGEVELGHTPIPYDVEPAELPQTLTFELDGYQTTTVEITDESSPIVVEVLDEQQEDARATKSSRRPRSKGSRSSSDNPTRDDISDEAVEQVLDEFLRE